MHPSLKKLIGNEGMQRRLAQVELIRDWLQFETPGVLIQRLIAPVDPRTPTGDHLCGRQKKKAGIAASVEIARPHEIQNHINDLRRNGFDPDIYNKKGYYLRGTIKTDWYNLQLAYKLKELHSVKYKRYLAELLPDRLTTATAGTSDYLTEVHNILKTPADVERLLGYTVDETHQESYLGLDLGQAFVVGAYAILSQDKAKVGKRRNHRHRKKRGSRGRCNRGSEPASVSSTGNTEAATVEHFSISTIESSILPLRGTSTNFANHIEYRNANTTYLNQFHNGHQFRFKKFKRMSKTARKREFHQLADSLFRMFVAQAESIRRLYCLNCQKYVHRDVLGGHDIVNILQNHVESQQPLYLHPVDEEGHYLWLEAASSSRQGGSNGDADRKRKADDGQVAGEMDKGNNTAIAKRRV
ncbi:hypothetical protein BGX20_009212 [Mortierella sp. AD010]|nr:hypothetical protein BGX20_009212 [Mortierella sp. AD010]